MQKLNVVLFFCLLSFGLLLTKPALAGLSIELEFNGQNQFSTIQNRNDILGPFAYSLEGRFKKALRFKNQEGATDYVLLPERDKMRVLGSPKEVPNGHFWYELNELGRVEQNPSIFDALYHTTMDLGPLGSALLVTGTEGFGPYRFFSALYASDLYYYDYSEVFSQVGFFNVFGMIAHDFDQDGVPELILNDFRHSRYKFNGYRFVSNPSPVLPQQISFGQFVAHRNSRTRKDLAIFNGWSLEVYQHNSNLNDFEKIRGLTHLENLPAPIESGSAIVDLNGDGFDEIIGTGGAVVYNDGPNHNWNRVETLQFRDPYNPTGFVQLNAKHIDSECDFNGDGIQDFLITRPRISSGSGNERLMVLVSRRPPPRLKYEVFLILDIHIQGVFSETSPNADIQNAICLNREGTGSLILATDPYSSFPTRLMVMGLPL